MLLANSADPDQMPHYAASDLGLHCLPMYPLLGFLDNNGLINVCSSDFQEYHVIKITALLLTSPHTLTLRDSTFITSAQA